MSINHHYPCSDVWYQGDLRRASCEAGRADTDSLSTTPCVDCAIGEYAAAASASCTTCASLGQFDSDRDPSTPCTETDICEQICDAGSHDDDCDSETPCVACVAGQYTAGGVASPVGLCSACVNGTTDVDSDPATECVDCIPGQYAEAGNLSLIHI